MNKRIIIAAAFGLAGILRAEEFPKPYSPPCTERPPLRRDLAPGAPGAGENESALTKKPKLKALGGTSPYAAFGHAPWGKVGTGR